MSSKHDQVSFQIFYPVIHSNNSKKIVKVLLIFMNERHISNVIMFL